MMYDHHDVVMSSGERKGGAGGGVGGCRDCDSTVGRTGNGVVVHSESCWSTLSWWMG